MGGSSQSKSPPQSLWEQIKTAWGCPNWFSLTNFADCFSDLSITEKVVFCATAIILSIVGVLAVLVLGDIMLGAEGLIEDIGSIFGDFSGMFEWLSSFIESAFGYVVLGTGYVFNESLQIANVIGESTGTPPLIWIFIAVAGLIWAALYVINDIKAEAESFKNSDAYPFFSFMNTPISWVVDFLATNIGTWAGTIAQVIVLPINVVILLLSELLGLIYNLLTTQV